MVTSTTESPRLGIVTFSSSRPGQGQDSVVWAKLDDRNSARGNFHRDTLSSAWLTRHFQVLIHSPLQSALDFRFTQTQCGFDVCIAIDLGQALLGLHHSIVIKESDHPTPVSSVHQVLHVATHIYRSGA